MGLPSQKRTNTSKRQRNAHIKLVPTKPVVCDNCDSPVLAHKACTNCGQYRGRKVVNTQKRITRYMNKNKTA